MFLSVSLADAMVLGVIGEFIAAWVMESGSGVGGV